MTDREELLIEASRLVVRGCNVISLLPRDKRPAEPWERWQTERQWDALPDLDDFDHWLRERWIDSDHNLGAVCGPVSGLLVVDADSPEAVGALLSLVPDDAGAVMVQTSKGMHAWFAYPNGERIGNRARVGGLELDIRGHGGYVVCPPSIHPSGHRYEWVGSPLEVWPPPPVPAALLELLRPPRPQSPGPRPAPRVGPRPYVQTAVRRELEAVQRAPVGTRNDSLNRSTFALARFVDAGELHASDLEAGLLHAAAAAGLPEHEARATIRSALGARTAT